MHTSYKICSELVSKLHYEQATVKLSVLEIAHDKNLKVAYRKRALECQRKNLHAIESVLAKNSKLDDSPDVYRTVVALALVSSLSFNIPVVPSAAVQAFRMLVLRLSSVASLTTSSVSMS